MRAAEEKEIRQNIEAQGLMCYNERLLEEYKNSTNEEHIVSTKFYYISICTFQIQYSNSLFHTLNRCQKKLTMSVSLVMKI